VVPRRFLPKQLRFNLAKDGHLTAQLVQLSSPWETIGKVLETASSNMAREAASTSDSSSSRSGVEHIQQQALPIPPGQVHPTTQAQLRALTPPFVLQAELDACRKMGLRLASAVAGPAVVGAELPHALADDQRLQAVLKGMESQGHIRVERIVTKAKVLRTTLGKGFS